MPYQIVHASDRLTLREDGTVHLLIFADNEPEARRGNEIDSVRIGHMAAGDFMFAQGVSLRPVLHEAEVEDLERAWADWLNLCADTLANDEREEWEAGYLADRVVGRVA